MRQEIFEQIKVGCSCSDTAEWLTAMPIEVRVERSAALTCWYERLLLPLYGCAGGLPASKEVHRSVHLLEELSPVLLGSSSDKPTRLSWPNAGGDVAVTMGETQH